MCKVIVVFKSIPDIFKKEKSGKKPNTLRLIDDKDIRFKALKLGIVDSIRIVNSVTKESFEREIKDYTEWNDYAVISWKEGKTKGEKYG